MEIVIHRQGTGYIVLNSKEEIIEKDNFLDKLIFKIAGYGAKLKYKFEYIKGA